MNKTEFIDVLALETGFSKVNAKVALDGFVSSLYKAIQKGDKISLVGFGTFSVTQRSARVGRNPQTGKQINIAAKKSIKFKAGKEFSNAVM